MCFVIAGVSKASYCKGLWEAGSSSSFAFKGTHTHKMVHFAHTQKGENLTIINYLRGILSCNFTETFWGPYRFILHLVKRGICHLNLTDHHQYFSKNLVFLKEIHT